MAYNSVEVIKICRMFQKQMESEAQLKTQNAKQGHRGEKIKNEELKQKQLNVLASDAKNSMRKIMDIFHSDNQSQSKMFSSFQARSNQTEEFPCVQKMIPLAYQSENSSFFNLLKPVKIISKRKKRAHQGSQKLSKFYDKDQTNIFITRKKFMQYSSSCEKGAHAFESRKSTVRNKYLKRAIEFGSQTLRSKKSQKLSFFANQNNSRNIQSNGLSNHDNNQSAREDQFYPTNSPSNFHPASKKVDTSLTCLQYNDEKKKICSINELCLSLGPTAQQKICVNAGLEETVSLLAQQIMHIMKEDKKYEISMTNSSFKKSEIRESVGNSGDRLKIIKMPSESRSIEIGEEEGVFEGKKKKNIEEDCEQIGNSNSQCSIEMSNLTKSNSAWGQSYQASTTRDFSCFDHETALEMPDLKEVLSFVELIVVEGLLEKEIPIIANVYVKRLLRCVNGSQVTQNNWKNIVLIALIEGSKIWDDQSLDNSEFAEFCQIKSALQINKLEKNFLFLLDFHLNITQKEYIQSFFELRLHSDALRRWDDPNFEKRTAETHLELKERVILLHSSDNMNRTF